MSLNGKTLEDWFSTQPFRDNIFPYNKDYRTDYAFIKSTLNQWVQPYVNSGSMINDRGYLTDHGPEHIKKVILRASQLIEDFYEISEYEAFILLVAIQIHDVGNIFSRVNHELSAIEVMKKLGFLETRDRIEWECIYDISEAHGGSPKDKISSLIDEPVLNLRVNKPLLAAILKFSDELADDRTRAERFTMFSGGLPVESVIYHKYAYCLHSITIDHRAKQIALYFDIDENDLKITFPKKAKDEANQDVVKDVYLLNEIYERTLKTHLERTYCMRFMRPFIDINKIKVAITIRLNDEDEGHKRIKKTISFQLGEVGYPTLSPHNITTLCPGLEHFTGEKVLEKILNKTLQNESI
jgi:hypothetical protein